MWIASVPLILGAIFIWTIAGCMLLEVKMTIAIPWWAALIAFESVAIVLGVLYGVYSGAKYRTPQIKKSVYDYCQKHGCYNKGQNVPYEFTRFCWGIFWHRVVIGFILPIALPISLVYGLGNRKFKQEVKNVGN